MKTFLFTIFCALSVKADDFPGYFDKCSVGDPDLFTCIVNSANKIIPNIVKGAPKFGIPVLDPFEISEIAIVPTKTLSATFRDVKISGLRKAKFTKMTTDLEHGRGTFTVFVEKLELSAEYEIHGQILVLPINGKGHGNMTLVNATFNTFEFWDVIRNDKDNEEYFHLKHFNLTYDMDRVYTHLDNLFDGNKVLGDNMNQVLNENWREFAKDVEPSVAETVSKVISNIINKLTLKVPAKYWFRE